MKIINYQSSITEDTQENISLKNELNEAGDSVDVETEAEANNESEEKPITGIEIADEEDDEHIDETSWADQYRDIIEDIGMKEYVGKGSRDLMSTLDHFLYSNFSQRENIMALADDEDEVSVSFQPENILILGQPGTGKSAIIEEWIKSRHIRGLKFTGSELRPSIIQGLAFKTTVYDKNLGRDVERQGMLGSTAFDLLDTENEVPSVLFIDEINRSMKEAEAAILTLVQSHTIPDKDSPTGERKFKNFLFTIAAANPDEGEGKDAVRKLSLALKSRFTTYFQESNIQETASYLQKKLDRLERGNQAKIKSGKKSANLGALDSTAHGNKKDILQALVDADIKYEGTEAGKNAAEKESGVFNARTLEMALLLCNGNVGSELEPGSHGRQFTPNSFLDAFASTCGPNKLDEVIEILDPIAEAQDNANGFQKTWMDKYNVWKKRYLKNHN